ncbi:MAG: contractile injection system protein, VgrG/Pvc8 family [Marinobacterium sp.]|nr:contractile injection system protein, VgrG/Pvc8 family [Marinobacterium sp.]
MSAIPDYRVTVNGQEFTRTMNALLVSLTLTDNREEDADQLDIVLDDSDGKLAIPPRGAIVKCWLGFRDEPLVYKGEYTVDEVSHSGAPDRITIRSRSSDFRDSLKIKQEYSWHKKTIGEIISTVASRNGLQPAVSPKLAGTFIEHIDQTNESDNSFLARLGHKYDATATIKDGKMIFTPAGKGETTGGQAISTVTLTRADGDQHNYQLLDKPAEYTGVKTFWNDTKEGVLRDITVGSADKARLLRNTYPTEADAKEADAKEAAQAELQRINRQQAQFSLLLAKGRPNLYPETPIKLQGWKAPIDANNWVTKRVVHQMNNSGYSSRVEMETLL